MSPRQINNLLKLFDYIDKRKNEPRIDEDKLAMLLDDKWESQFWWPTKEELEDWVKG